MLMLPPTVPPTSNPCLAEAADKTPPRQLFARHAWWVLAAFAILADFAMVPIVSSVRNGPPSPLLFCAVGCTLAQGSLLAAWLVLLEGPFWRRLVWHWCLALGLWLVWFVGLALAAPSPREIVDIGFTVACITPLISLGAQLPIWATRHFFGWRLAHLAADAPPAKVSQLSIRDLLFATLVVAVTFAAARLAPALRENEFWIAIIVGLTIASIISTIAILPAAAMLLRPRPFRHALALTGGYTFTLIGLHWLVVGFVRWYGGPLPPAVLHVGLSLLMLSYCGTCCLAAYVARQGGFYLARNTESNRKALPI